MSSLLSEVETMDTLPFAKSSSPALELSAEPKLPAPSIEEVDANPEGLRALRGQGRYFGMRDDEDGGIKEAEPKCNNCSQRGHFKRNCPHVICTYCGSMDDHYSQHCSKAIKCSNCNESGHYRSQCPQKWKRVFCTLCNSKRHSRDRCPSIWRVYLLKDDAKQEALPMHRLYCYNCGRKGHFGDDCTDRRSSRVPNEDGSAFSGDNLSLDLKRQYFKNVAKQRREEYSAMRYDDFDYDDYEYDDALYDEPQVAPNNSKSKSKKRKQSNFHPPPYRKREKVVQPVQRGGTLPPASDRTHPLDFPRSNRNASRASHNMNNSRYGKPSSNRTMNQGDYKNYNSYKPFRSGTLKR